MGSMAYTFYRAPLLQDPIWRYACAGTAANLFCEVIMHSVDTINMRSKIINGPKLYVFELLKLEGVSSLMRGIQPVLYGYFVASMVYFYTYAHLKSWLMAILFGKGGIQTEHPREDDSAEGKQSPKEPKIPKNTDEASTKKDGSTMIYKTMAVSFLGSGIAEFVSLAFYYPFDLIKTRM